MIKKNDYCIKKITINFLQKKMSHYLEMVEELIVSDSEMLAIVFVASW